MNRIGQSISRPATRSSSTMDKPPARRPTHAFGTMEGDRGRTRMQNGNQKPSTRVIFFDAEGTLWTPRAGRTMKDFWDGPSLDKAKDVFQVEPGVHDLLARLKQEGHRLVVLSRHREHLLPGILKAFRLVTFFDDILINGDKGDRAAAWLHDRKIPREQALMVGDREDLDITPLKRAGIQALLVDRPYNKHVRAARIRTLDEVRQWL